MTLKRRMRLNYTLYVLLTVSMFKDYVLCAEITISPDYVYRNTPLNVTCRGTLPISGMKATFYRQNITFSTVQYINNNCTSDTNWYYYCDQGSNVIGLIYEPTSNTSTTESYYCRFDNGISTDASNIITVRTAVQPTGTAVSPSTTQYTMTEGQALGSISCSSNCRPECSYQWIFPDGSTLDSKILNIASLNRSHHGTFTCRIQNDIGEDSISINIVINYGPTNTRISPPTSQYTITEGDALQTFIICSSTCRPACSYRWNFPNGETLNSRYFYVSSIKKSHNGTFTCIVYNSVGEDTISLNIKVNYGPSDTKISPSTSQYTKTEGGTIGIITCSSNCSPACNYKWIFPNGETLNSSGLSISALNRSHHGSFKCMAQNAIGHDTITISIIVNYRPGNIALSPVQTEYTVVEYRSLDISCSADCRPECTYYWSGPVTSSNNRLQISSIRRTQKGSYRCRATNNLGIIYSSFVAVTVHTMPTTVQKVVAKCIGATEAVISWLPDFTVVPAQTFILHYKPNNGEMQNITFKESHVQHDIYVQHIENLRPSTEYIYTISSMNSQGSRTSDQVSCITTAEDSATDSSIHGVMIGGIVLMIMAVILITVVIVLVLLHRYRKSEDKSDENSSSTNFINGCMAHIPCFKKRNSNYYENTHRRPYENITRETGDQTYEGLGNTELQSNNFYEQLNTQNKSKTSKNQSKENSRAVTKDKNDQSSSKYVNYVNVAKRKKPPMPKKPVKIQQTKT